MAEKNIAQLTAILAKIGAYHPYLELYNSPIFAKIMEDIRKITKKRDLKAISEHGKCAKKMFDRIGIEELAVVSPHDIEAK